MSTDKRILDLLLGAVSDGVFPGCVLLVSHRRKIVFFEGVGNSGLIPTPRPMTRQTRFDLASLTKPLATTLSILCLVSRGMVRLDDSLAKLLSSTTVPEDKQEISLRQLLSHCSGLPAWKPYYLSLTTLPLMARKVQIRRQILEEPLIYPPAANTLYSDLGFIVIQWLLEEISGKDFYHFTREDLFDHLICATPEFIPLGQEKDVDHNQFADTEYCPWRDRILSGEVHDENAYALGGVAGHAGLFGTAQEIKCVLDCILDTISGENTSFPWSREYLTEFLQPAHLHPVSTWALGFDTPASSHSSAGRYFSSRSVGHLGFTGTSFWLDLEKGISVILLTNRIHPSRANEKIKEFRPLLHDAVMEGLA
ncbi:MAG: serine hydrolase [Deltaproteobacteria bacterium]|jgi:CubicO group peptidase (beta-lactamase class C family)